MALAPPSPRIQCHQRLRRCQWQSQCHSCRLLLAIASLHFNCPSGPRQPQRMCCIWQLSDLLVCYPHDRPLPGHDSLQGWPELVKLVSLGALQQMIATLEKPPPPPPKRTPKDPRTPWCGIIFEELRQHYAKSTQPASYHPEDKCGACNERMLWRMPHVDPTHRCAGSGCSLPLHGSGVCSRVLGESPVMYCSEKCRRNPLQ